MVVVVVVAGAAFLWGWSLCFFAVFVSSSSFVVILVEAFTITWLFRGPPNPSLRMADPRMRLCLTVASREIVVCVATQ